MYEICFYNKTAKTTASPRFGEAGLPVDIYFANTLKECTGKYKFLAKKDSRWI